MIINNKQDRKQELRLERARKQARLIALAVAASGETGGKDEVIPKSTSQPRSN